MRTRVSLALLSLRKNWGLLVVYRLDDLPAAVQEMRLREGLTFENSRN